jgi:hypothetical protein
MRHDQALVRRQIVHASRHRDSNTKSVLGKPRMCLGYDRTRAAQPWQNIIRTEVQFGQPQMKGENPSWGTHRRARICVRYSIRFVYTHVLQGCACAQDVPRARLEGNACSIG